MLSQPLEINTNSLPMKKQILTLAAVSILLWSCTNETKKASDADSTTKTEKPDSTVKTENTAINDGHNAQNSLDWNGTYKGVLPCADCEGIQTELTLNQDMTFVLKTNYMGKDTKFPEDKGTFKWDSTGSKVELIGLKDQPNTYFVGENKLIQLDMEGKEITGTLADKYILKK